MTVTITDLPKSYTITNVHGETITTLTDVQYDLLLYYLRMKIYTWLDYNTY